MKYLLLTYLDEKAWANMSEAEQQKAMAECAPHIGKLQATGKFLAGAPLHPTWEAKTAQVRDGKPLVTDGPFAETREQLGGYTLIDAKDLDEAVNIATGFLGKRGLATIEVRQVIEHPGLPSH